MSAFTGSTSDLMFYVESKENSYVMQCIVKNIGRYFIA